MKDERGGTGSSRIIAPKPSTIAISDSHRTIGSPTPHLLKKITTANVRTRGGAGRANMLLLPSLDRRHANGSPRRAITAVGIKPAVTLDALDDQRLARRNIGENFVSRKVQSRFMRHGKITRISYVAARLTYVRFKK